VNWTVTSAPGPSGVDPLNASPRSLTFTVFPKISDLPFLLAAAGTETG